MSEYLDFEPTPDRSIWKALIAVADNPRLLRLAAEARRMLAFVRPAPHAGSSESPGWKDFSRAIEVEKDSRANANIRASPNRFPAQFLSLQKIETLGAGTWRLTGRLTGGNGQLAIFTAVQGTQHVEVMSDEASWLQLFRNLVPIVTADKLLALLKQGRTITFPGVYTSEQLRTFHFRGLE